MYEIVFFYRKLILMFLTRKISYAKHAAFTWKFEPDFERHVTINQKLIGKIVKESGSELILDIATLTGWN